MVKNALKKIKIPVYKPFLDPNSVQLAKNALDSTWISSNGQYIDKAEKELSKIIRGKVGLTTSNGTAAMHIAAKVLKKHHPRVKKIICPNNVFVAAWNSFVYDGHFELIAVDADLDSWNWREDVLFDTINKHGQDDVALLVVHNIGNIVNVPKIKRLFPRIPIIEDNCEGLFGSYEGKPSGSECLASAVSFFGNKSITSGEGGAVFVHRAAADFVKKIRGQGQTSEKFLHDELGHNYRMTNIQAALLLGQIIVKDDILERKKKVFAQYKEELSGLVLFQKIEDKTEHSNWMFGIRIDDSSSYEKKREFFDSRGVETRPMFYPITAHAHLNKIKSMGGITNAKKLNQQCVILPSFPELTQKQVSVVCDAVKSFVSG